MFRTLDTEKNVRRTGLSNASMKEASLHKPNTVRIRSSKLGLERATGFEPATTSLGS